MKNILKLSLIFHIFVFAVIFQNLIHAQSIPLTIQNREAIAKVAEPISSGIPFARGVLTDAAISNVRLLVDGVETPSQFDAVAHWSDGSVRWLHAHFQADLPASGSVPATLELGASPAPYTGVTVSDSNPGSLEGAITVNTGSTTYTFTKRELLLGGKNIYASAGGIFRAVPVIVSQSLPTEPIALNGWSIEGNGSMKAVVKVEGKWLTEKANPKNIKKNQAISFVARLFFYRNHNDFRVQLIFRNNNSYGFEDRKERKPALNLKSLAWGKKTKLLAPTQFLSGSKKYAFYSGVEKTIDLYFTNNNCSPVVIDSRYNANGTLASNYTAPRPLALCTPAYYASTKAWGMITVPKTVLIDGADIADFNLYEKIQRAKVIQADVENPPGTTGITLWGQLHFRDARHKINDINSWAEYGELRWAGNGTGTISANHYDWIYGMYLQMMRTGRLEFGDAARVFAKSEIDFDIYHTALDGNAYNYQKNWESRPIHNSPGNDFGPGRPTHTWSQGYAVHWLLTGDYRGKDAFDEIIEGIRLYLYESFNGEGYVDTSEIRTQGWITENLANAWRINPDMTFTTTSYGTKTISDSIEDTLQNVFEREAEAGGDGYVFVDPEGRPGLISALQHCYFTLPAIKAYDEILRETDPAYAVTLLALITRMTDWIMTPDVTFGGDTNASGLYRPLQIPFEINNGVTAYGTIPYLMMSADAAAFLYSETATASYRTYARSAFRDCVRYFGVTAGDDDPEHTRYIDPTLRTPTAYNSAVFGASDGLGTESKINGWMNRYGQYYMNVEN